MKLLLDTHLLLWAAAWPDRLPGAAHALMKDTANQLVFSAASLWEVAIKHELSRQDFAIDPRLLKSGLVDNGYAEMPISGAHAAAVSGLPPIHKDPFDRMLIAQATIEGITLLTCDPIVAQYPGPVRRV